MSKNKRPKNAESNLDNSPKVEQRDKIKENFLIKQFPWTEKQKNLINIALDKQSSIIFIKSPAGTGKTLVSLFCCLELLNKKSIGEVTYFRAAIESGESIGFIPGEKESKLEPYGMPIFDHFNELLNKSSIDTLIKDDRIKVESIGFAKGRTYNVAGLIVDEAEDLSIKELRLLMTRLGKFSKMFIIGDEKQSNIKNSGFKEVFDMFNTETAKQNGIYTFEFTKEDCMRNKITQFIIEQFENPKSMFPPDK